MAHADSRWGPPRAHSRARRCGVRAGDVSRGRGQALTYAVYDLESAPAAG